MGSYDGSGNFISPISYTESQTLPKAMMDTFLEMDYLYAIAKRVVEKEKKPGK